MASTNDPHEVLGLHPSASRDETRKRYRRAGATIPPRRERWRPDSDVGVQADQQSPGKDQRTRLKCGEGRCRAAAITAGRTPVALGTCNGDPTRRGDRHGSDGSRTGGGSRKPGDKLGRPVERVRSHSERTLRRGPERGVGNRGSGHSDGDDHIGRDREQTRYLDGLRAMAVGLAGGGRTTVERRGRKRCGRQPVGRELPRQEVPGRDDALLPLGVAGQVEDRHPLPPHPRHRTEAVGGRHEDGVGQGRARDRDSGRGTPRRARGRRPRGGPPARRRRRRRRGGRSRRGRTRGRERRTLSCLTRSVIETDPQHLRDEVVPGQPDLARGCLDRSRHIFRQRHVPNQQAMEPFSCSRSPNRRRNPVSVRQSGQVGVPAAARPRPPDRNRHPSTREIVLAPPPCPAGDDTRPGGALVARRRPRGSG